MSVGAALEAGRRYDARYRRVRAEPRCGDNFALRLGANGYRRLDEARQDAAYLGAVGIGGEILLDLGSGPGRYSHWLARRTGAFPMGIDASFEAVRLAAGRRMPGAVLQGDAGRLPLRGQSIGAAISLDLLQAMGAPSSLFDELARVLRPGGRAVIVALATRTARASAALQIAAWRRSARRAGLLERAAEDATFSWRRYMYARHRARIEMPAGRDEADLRVSRAMIDGVIDRTQRLCLRLEAPA